MFPLPYKDFVQLFKKPKNYLECGVDRLSSWIGSSFMLIFCIISSAGLGFGNHFECMIPGDFKSTWEKFLLEYCYVQPHFYANNSNGDVLPQIYYFPWFPYFFFGHALAFYLPKIFWEVFARPLCQANLINKSTKDDDKKKKIEALATYMTTTLKFSSGGDASPYFLLSSTALLFLFKKFLYVLVACSQFYVICHYIGQGNYYWGFEVVSRSIKTIDYLPSRFFPLFTQCRAPIAQNNVYIKKTVSCIMSMNVIYEKFYVFTYFMLLGIIIASFLSALYYTSRFITPFRTDFIDNLLGFGQSIVPIQNVRVFIHDYLGADGFLSILLIQQNFGDEVAQNILKELWNHTSTFALAFKKKSNAKLPLLTSTPNRYAPIPTKGLIGGDKYGY